MKAHTTEKQEKEIILSIGMIVKNEEKVLERCLKSLQPLMKAIPSELIIADTGSIDSTVEIAKKYTDNVFHFEWINDFAAARNSTLKRAKGVWYFFLDADEYLDEDIHEIVEFFKIPQLYYHYKCAEIVVRNYSDNERQNYNSMVLPRFHRLKGNDKDEIIEFVGSIHETIYIRNPLGYFQTVLHHTGYLFQSAAQLHSKQERNLELMREEYKATEYSKRHRIISLLLDSASSYEEEMEKYLKEALDLVKLNKDDVFSRGLMVQAINYYRNNNPFYALDLCEKYYKTYSDASKYVATVSVSLLKAEILYSIGDYGKACEEFSNYRVLYKKYKQDLLDISDCTFRALKGLRESEYVRSKAASVDCLSKLRRYSEAFELLDSFDLAEIKDCDYTTFIEALQRTCMRSRKFERMAEHYKNVFDVNNDNMLSITLDMLENTFYSYSLKKDRIDFAKQMVGSGVKGKYIEMMQLFLSQNDEDFINKLSGFINSVYDWKNGYTEVIYLAVKNNINIAEAVDKMPASLFGEKLGFIANTHDDFAGLVLDYGIPEQFSANIKRFSWIVTMYEVSAYRCFELNDNKKYELYMRFTNLLGEYVSNIYNPELLQDEDDIQVLPPLHKFGFYMLQANNKLMNGENIGYIKEMKKALLNCEPMKEIVEFMLEQFKKKIGM